MSLTETLAPTGAGSHTGLIPQPSGTNWSNMVSDDGLLVLRSGPGNEWDMYTMANTAIPDAAIIEKVVVTLSGLYSDGGGYASTGVCIGGVAYGNDPIVAITGDSLSFEMTVNPATSSTWTKSAINGAELFVLLGAASGKYSYANRVYATVYYTLRSSGQVRFIGMAM